MFIKSIQFGILSSDMMRQCGVCQIQTTKMSGAESVYDPRMGPNQNGELCKTCGFDIIRCIGHFGYIELSVPIIHPLFYRETVNIAKCLCYHCHRLMCTPENFESWKGCKFADIERRIQLFHKYMGSLCPFCKKHQPSWILRNDIVNVRFSGEPQIECPVPTIKDMFYGITSEELTMFGFDDAFMHPKYLILECLPVLPPRSRPLIVTDKKICDDDLTTQYIEIIKANQTVDVVGDAESVAQLISRISVLMNNNKNKSRYGSCTSVIKSIKERLTGKHGVIRENIMGKRVNMSARTVIGPAPDLDIDEIGVPSIICDTLTYPVMVYRYNYNIALRWIHLGKITYVHRTTANGVMNIRVEYAIKSKTNPFKLQIGDTVDRKLDSGDIIILNRQPTLHKASMLAKRVVREVGTKTIRLNLATTSCFNGDFDGD
jgi:DNA-directed RNA polymerase beta' subunit